MDLRYHVAAFGKVLLPVSGAQSVRSVRAYAATCLGEQSIQRPNRCPACRFGGACTRDRGRSDCGSCDQASKHRGADHGKVRGASDNCAVQRRIRLLRHCDQAFRIDQFDRDHAIFPGVGGGGG